MGKIWYRNPSKSEVIGRCGGDEKTDKAKNNVYHKQVVWVYGPVHNI